MAGEGIIVLKNKVPQGPFTRTQVEEGLQRGDFTLNYLAHAVGLRDWLPLGEVLHHHDKVAQPPAPTDRRVFPPLPVIEETILVAGPLLPRVPVLEEIPALKTQPPVLPPVEAHRAEIAATVFAERDKHRSPAPFIRRFMAFVIDCSVLFMPLIALSAVAYLMIVVKGSLQHDEDEAMRQAKVLLFRNLRDLIGLVAIGFAWFYAAGLESSRWQATVGKQWMGMVVTDLKGERLTFLHASGRHLAKYLSALPFFLGFLAAAFNTQRVSLHDRLAGTRVVKL